jgi:hypothetical protein
MLFAAPGGHRRGYAAGPQAAVGMVQATPVPLSPQ